MCIKKVSLVGAKKTIYLPRENKNIVTLCVFISRLLAENFRCFYKRSFNTVYLKGLCTGDYC